MTRPTAMLSLVTALSFGCSPATEPQATSATPTSIAPEIPRPTDVSGGAWLTKRAGQSDVLRGLTIYLLAKDLPKRDCFDAIDVARKNADFLVDTWGGNPEKESDAKSVLALARGIQTEVLWLDQIPPDTRIDTRKVYGLIRFSHLRRTVDDPYQVERIESDAIWPKIAVSATIAKAVTDIDGKYLFRNVDPGRYYLYAPYQSSASVVEWMVPVDLTAGKPTSIDLFNDNADSILNRES